MRGTLPGQLQPAPASLLDRIKVAPMKNAARDGVLFVLNARRGGRAGDRVHVLRDFPSKTTRRHAKLCCPRTMRGCAVPSSNGTAILAGRCGRAGRLEVIGFILAVYERRGRR